MRHYTYAHYRNDTGQMFYIGKGVGRRAWVRQNRSPRWHHIVQKHGYSVQVLARFDAEADALEHEAFLIACCRDLGVDLCNITAGGEGANGLTHSEETKARISAAMRGRVMSADAKAKLSAARKGMVFSDQHLANMSAVRLGKPGHKHTDEAKAKIAAARRGKPGSAQSIETRKKRSESMKATIARKRAEGVTA